MALGMIALILAGLGAGWLLFRLAGGEKSSGDRNVMIMKLVVWFALAAALFAVNLRPLAFMVLLAAGGVTMIEAWRDKRVAAEKAADKPAPSLDKSMTPTEAAAVLGVAVDADMETVNKAYKKLISQIHPDRGGTDYLASKINEAREVLSRSAPITPHTD